MHAFILFLGLVLVSVGCSSGSASREAQRDVPKDTMIYVIPASMKRIGTIDLRFQSYNVEMLEVTGGKFWKPYGPELDALLLKGQQAASTAPGGDTPAGMNPALYQYRPPIDLTNARLRKLAQGLAPAYVRVSGTWANTTYFPNSDQAPKSPPAGFNGVLTRQQWEGLVSFAKAVDARIVTSFAISPGTRDAAGAWTPAQASRLLNYTKSIGGRIAAAEFMNEPNLASMGGAPVGYDATAYGRDFKLFRDFAKRYAPEMLILGPGSVGETTGEWGVAYGTAPVLNTRDLLVSSGPGIDAFSYHHYGATSRRCAALGKQTAVDAALSEEWLARTDQTLAFYRKLRDEFEPGKSFWNTETADTACGGNPWGRTYFDTFRYLDQLGRLAKQDVHVVAHNTLVASDYGLLDEDTLTPRPNYWGALLWRRLMGTTVLESGIPIQAGLHVYAHCLRGTPGGVAILAMNNSRTAPNTIAIPAGGDRYTLAAGNLDNRRVQLNGTELALTTNDELPTLTGVAMLPGNVTLEPATISFFALPRAGNDACP
jgi:Glycosyl hydrolase family 79, N-terminal domain